MVEDVAQGYAAVRAGALDTSRVSGLTHRHYKYPARFSPAFARAAVEAFSAPGQLVLDPFMGGGTTIVEALATGRRAVGCDLNSLSVFVARVKSHPLSKSSAQEVCDWASFVTSAVSCRDHLDAEYAASGRVRNLSGHQSRAVSKYIGLCIQEAEKLKTLAAREFARCVLLNVGQTALHGRRRALPVDDVRTRIVAATSKMISASAQLRATRSKGRWPRPVLIHGSSELIDKHPIWRRSEKADLVVTSPPYPGVHVLYHRWQINGRRESAAPYWIANRLDGQGGAYYNFGERRRRGNSDYFENLERCLRGIRNVLKDGAYFVQLVAFSNPTEHLPAFLDCMNRNGFLETAESAADRAWREVPSRSWHAQLKGNTSGALEVALVHRAC